MRPHPRYGRLCFGRRVRMLWGVFAQCLSTVCCHCAGQAHLQHAARLLWLLSYCLLPSNSPRYPMAWLFISVINRYNRVAYWLFVIDPVVSSVPASKCAARSPLAPLSTCVPVPMLVSVSPACLADHVCAQVAVHAWF
eukprot:4587858-Pleurochrysis_carterae.AAC.3